MHPLNADAFGVAALSVAAAIVFKLIDAGVMSKEDAVEMYDQIALAKRAKAQLYKNSAEGDAAVLAETMRMEIEARY